MTPTMQQSAKLSGRLWPDDEHATFAVLDGAGIPGLLDRLYGAPALEFACLFEGDIAADIAEVAPYLVRVLPGSEMADWSGGRLGRVPRHICAGAGGARIVGVAPAFPQTHDGVRRRHAPAPVPVL